jgi:hypothetical protein
LYKEKVVSLPNNFKIKNKVSYKRYGQQANDELHIFDAIFLLKNFSD